MTVVCEKRSERLTVDFDVAASDCMACCCWERGGWWGECFSFEWGLLLLLCMFDITNQKHLL